MSGSARGGGWPRILLDVSVVVVGILIAFGLNAWWEMRSAYDREAAHLEALRSDLETNVQDLERLVGLQASVASASLELLRVARGEATVSRDSIDGLMDEVFSSNRFDATMGAYGNLVSSGGLAQLRAPELRVALATFASMVDSRYVEQFSTALYLEFMRAFVGRTGWADAVLADMRLDGEPEAPASPSAPGRPRWNHALLEDPVFQEHLALRHATERQVGQRYAELAAQARMALSHLDGR